MPNLARREQIAEAIVAALTAGCAPVPVERNRRALVDSKEAPILVVFDLGHSASNDVAQGCTTYVMDVAVEGTVGGVSDADLGPSVSALYVTILQSLRDYTLGGLCVDLRETGLQVDLAASDVSKPLVTFSLALEVTFMTPDGDPTG